jgi:hypothetical protein
MSFLIAPESTDARFNTYSEEMNMSIYDIFTTTLDIASFLPHVQGLWLLRSTYRVWFVSDMLKEEYLANLETQEGLLEQATETNEDEIAYQLQTEQRINDMNADTDSYIIDDDRQTYSFEDDVIRDMIWEKLQFAISIFSLYLMIKNK